MFDTVILITGAIETPILSGVLRRCNPHLTVHPVTSAAELRDLPADLLRRARLIAFATNLLVPGRTLAQLGYGAYNFHPGPPDYPGRTPVHFAIYDRATTFGTTAHAMVERVDAGPIVDIETFDIPPQTDLTELCELSYSCLARQFWRLAPELSTRAEPLPALPIQWSARKSTAWLYERMCDIPLDIANDELERRIAAFGTGHFGVDPTITLHGHRFVYVGNGTPAHIEAPSIVPEQRFLEAAE